MRDKRIVKKAVWETTDGLAHENEPAATEHQQFLDIKTFFLNECTLNEFDAINVTKVLLTQFKIEKFPEKMRG